MEICVTTQPYMKLRIEHCGKHDEDDVSVREETFLLPLSANVPVSLLNCICNDITQAVQIRNGIAEPTLLKKSSYLPTN